MFVCSEAFMIREKLIVGFGRLLAELLVAHGTATAGLGIVVAAAGYGIGGLSDHTDLLIAGKVNS